MRYKGFQGSIEWNKEDELFRGEVQGIKASVRYQGEVLEHLKMSFENSVNDYLDSVRGYYKC